MTKTLPRSHLPRSPSTASDAARVAVAGDGASASRCSICRPAKRARACSPFTAFSTRAAAGPLAIYEAGGGSTSFLPLDVLRRAHVTVVDIDDDQIRNNDYAQETILGDIQTYRFAARQLRSRHLLQRHRACPRRRGRAERLLRGAETERPDPDRRAEPEVAVRHRHEILAALVPCLVLPPCARREERRPARPGAVPDPFPSAGHAVELEAFAQAHGLQTIYRKQYESPRFPEMRPRKPLLATLLDAVAEVDELLLPGKTDVRHGDYHVILRKR